MPGGFQTQVNVQPAPALEGDFASANPRFSVLAGAGGLVAGASGVTIGRFAWAVNPSDPDESPTILNSFGSGLPTGFVHREQQALITAFLADASMVVPKGFPVTAMSGGDFWVKNNGTTQAFIGNKVYVNFKDGTAYFAATGATPTQASIVGTITAATAVFIGSVADEILTVASFSSGTVTIGSVLTGGTGLVTGVNIVSQLSGSIGGVGTYSLNE